MNSLKEDIKYMYTCINIAKQGKVPFGAIITDNLNILGRGYLTQIKIKTNSKKRKKIKSYHAETIALNQLDRNSKPKTIYTTIEPCLESSKNEISCSEKVIQHEIPRAVIGLLDPNPYINGQSIAYLSEKNIRVDVLEGLEKEIFFLNKNYFLGKFNNRGIQTRKINKNNIQKDFEFWYSVYQDRIKNTKEKLKNNKNVNFINIRK
jgi:pyrimidine deaminase RibD-like protein